jgi:hypothetical protein
MIEPLIDPNTGINQSQEQICKALWALGVGRKWTGEFQISAGRVTLRPNGDGWQIAIELKNRGRVICEASIVAVQPIKEESK